MPVTDEELYALHSENDQLHAELIRLRAENERLREKAEAFDKWCSSENQRLLDRIRELGDENERLQEAFYKESHEVEQRLGQALGYPWYKDDPKNFPDATEADGVCVGEHVPGTIAAEAASRIRELEDDRERGDG